MAITSLILGILGYMGLGFLTGIPSIVCGHKAKHHIDKSEGTLDGRGLAITGLIFGYSVSVLSFLLIALFVGIAVMEFRFQRDPTTKNRTVREKIAVALDIYEMDVGNYPSTQEGLNVLLKQPTNAPTWKGPYIHTKILDPWSNAYHYQLISTYKYTLISSGPDGIFGTPDDINN